MAPMTRNHPPSEQPIFVHDSDSEPETAERHTHKRQKTSLGKCLDAQRLTKLFRTRLHTHLRVYLFHKCAFSKITAKRSK